jgi:hypothetical protein
VSEFDRSIPLSDFDGYDGVPVAPEGSLFAGSAMRGPSLDRSFQIPIICKQGAARLGD